MFAQQPNEQMVQRYAEATANSNINTRKGRKRGVSTEFECFKYRIKANFLENTVRHIYHVTH